VPGGSASGAGSSGGEGEVFQLPRKKRHSVSQLARPKGSDYGETKRILGQLMGGGMSFDSSFTSINGESKAEPEVTPDIREPGAPRKREADKRAPAGRFPRFGSSRQVSISIKA